LFLTLCLFQKFPEKNLNGFIGLELFQIVILSFQSFLQLSNTINDFTLSEFRRRLDLYVNTFYIWKQRDMELYLEQLMEYIYRIDDEIQKIKECNGEKNTQQIEKLNQERMKRRSEYCFFKNINQEDAEIQLQDHKLKIKSFEETLHSAIETQFEKAFEDLLIHDLENNNYSYLIKNINDILDQIKECTPNNKTQQNKIENTIDKELIQQMIQNNAFTIHDFYRLIKEIQSIFYSYHAPIDQEKFEQEFQKNIEDLLSDVTNSTKGTLSIKEYAGHIRSVFKLFSSQIYVIRKRMNEFYNLFE